MKPLHEADRIEAALRTWEPGAKLLRRWPLYGGISTHMTAFEIEHPDGRRRKLIARQPAPYRLRTNLNAAAEEFRLLQILDAAGLPVPSPCFLEPPAEDNSERFYIVAYIEGTPDINPPRPSEYLRRYADQLAAIHRLDASQYDLSFLPQRTETVGPCPAVLNEALREGEIRDTLEGRWSGRHPNLTVLRHGDFWPGNVLWQDGEIAGVIDWEEAALGEPLADLAICRLDLLWVVGMEAVNAFTDLYQARMALDMTDLPVWDLWASLRPMTNLDEWAAVYPGLGRGDITGDAMRAGHRQFVEQALAKLDT